MVETLSSFYEVQLCNTLLNTEVIRFRLWNKLLYIFILGWNQPQVWQKLCFFFQWRVTYFIPPRNEKVMIHKVIKSFTHVKQQKLGHAKNRSSRSVWSVVLWWCLLWYWLGSWQARISARRHRLPFQLWGRIRMYRATTGVANWLITGVSLSTFP